MARKKKNNFCLKCTSKQYCWDCLREQSLQKPIITLAKEKVHHKKRPIPETQ